jgi:hypothetical protein
MQHVMCWMRQLSKFAAAARTDVQAPGRCCSIGWRSGKLRERSETVSAVFAAVLPDIKVLVALAKQLCCLCWGYPTALCHVDRMGYPHTR